MYMCTIKEKQLESRNKRNINKLEQMCHEFSLVHKLAVNKQLKTKETTDLTKTT